MFEGTNPTTTKYGGMDRRTILVASVTKCANNPVAFVSNFANKIVSNFANKNKASVLFSLFDIFIFDIIH